jgi:hypothetical protein
MALAKSFINRSACLEFKVPELFVSYVCHKASTALVPMVHLG